jgi:hypothetical protein
MDLFPWKTCRADLHRSHLSNREVHEGEANKHNQKRPDHAGGSAIGHDRCEGCEYHFPCCNQSARKPDHRSELEIPLLGYVRSRMRRRVCSIMFGPLTYAQLLYSPKL